MPLLREEDREYLKKEFEKVLKDKVRVLGFVRGEDCKYCRETKELLEEVASLSDKIELVFPESGEEYGIEEVPAVVVQDEKGELGTRVRFLGIPSGYEFTALIKDIMYVSTRTLEISESTIEELQNIENKIVIEVYVTPSCPYCPRAVLLAHQFAMVSEKNNRSYD
ncbi:thioredoxin family protein [Ferroglobus placidus]|uniref:thioredoxin family protein n=1 Tax=Ferroglobus placidus TaxID=54261 RepID=UPI0001B75372|nr:thioredoxin family protein [Ferroglobus placidus]